GKEKKSLVLDATYDYEVWNQPLLSYSYTYFNPQTLDAAPSAKEATVTRDEFTNDKFKKYRAPDAKKFVGIAMEIRYVAEVQPSQEDIDAPTRDAITRVRYLYDLELDADGIIIGGEWYSNKHPDFLWKPSRRARALSSADYYILSESWESGSPVPQHWRKLALNVSKNGQPIGKIVEALIQMSQNNQNEVQPELGGSEQ
ncbi:MAG: hypothetical protein KDD25_09255, partial [Bdellovibrionales bacterium]|nr:hypothetical protein [Bdellovibrionales bacterium]